MVSVCGSDSQPCGRGKRQCRCCVGVTPALLLRAGALPATTTSILFAFFFSATIVRGVSPARSRVLNAAVAKRSMTPLWLSAPPGCTPGGSRLLACTWAGECPVQRTSMWVSLPCFLSSHSSRHICATSPVSAALAPSLACTAYSLLPAVYRKPRTTFPLSSPLVPPPKRCEGGNGRIKTPKSTIRKSATAPTGVAAPAPTAKGPRRATALSEITRQRAFQTASTALWSTATKLRELIIAQVPAAVPAAAKTTLTRLQVAAVVRDSPASTAGCFASCLQFNIDSAAARARRLLQFSVRDKLSSFASVSTLRILLKQGSFRSAVKSRTPLHFDNTCRLQVHWCRSPPRSISGFPFTATVHPTTEFSLSPALTRTPVPRATPASSAGLPRLPATPTRTATVKALRARVEAFMARRVTLSATASRAPQRYRITGFAAACLPQLRCLGEALCFECERQRQHQQTWRSFSFLTSRPVTMKPTDATGDLLNQQQQSGTDNCCGRVRVVGSDWQMPSKEGKLVTGLIVNNSMTGGKVEFVPQEGNRVCWYACGPTVYDASHMGHARTYVTFDLIRRIMSDYFNYDVAMCMNITDIDDKIIKRSVEQGVNFLQLARHWEKDFFEDMAALNVRLPTVVTRVSEHIPEVLGMIGRILKNGYAYESQGSVYFDTQAFDGSERHAYGRMEPSSVADESRVLEGEGDLGVISTGKRHLCDFALWKKAKEGEPSWDSPWGKGRPGHFAKERILETPAKHAGCKGVGAPYTESFSSCAYMKSNEEVIAGASSNYPGRYIFPGSGRRWHIECSAMADSVFPFPLDIHSGGIDLRFPHHDNELAQSEAANDKPRWVNYFLHSGHLHIRGAKMSKSLKNFITIKECLARFSPRHLRLLCLMNRWDSVMNYSPDGETMQQAVDVDRSFVDFFALVRAKLRDAMPVAAHPQKWEASEVALSDELHCAKEQVHSCLLDNFNTPGVLVALQRLMSAANTYLNQHKGGNVRSPLVRAVAQYVFRMLRIFGVVKDEDEELQYSRASATTEAGAMPTGGEVEKLLQCIGSFREQVRTFAAQTLKSLQEEQRKRREDDASASPYTPLTNNEHEAGEGVGSAHATAVVSNGVSSAATVKERVKELLQACDALRDEKLRSLGILLQDRPDGTFVIKRVGKEEFDREMELKEEEERKRSELKKERLRLAAELQEKKKLERQTAPQDYYKVLHGDQYGTYDADGVPLTLKSGEEVSKSQRQKMQKFLQKHEKVYKEAQELDAAVKKF